MGEATHEDLPTKADLAKIAAELAHCATKADLAEVEADLLKWVIGAIGFQTVVILGALASLGHVFAK